MVFSVSKPWPSLVVVLVCVGVATAQDPCGYLNFFPTAAQITGLTASQASLDVTPDVTCRGSQVCNWPSVWNKTSQEANLTALGTSISSGGLLSVAVKEYGTKQLRLFFAPVSPLLTLNANAMTCVMDKTPAATRKLMAASYAVTQPGKWSYSVSFSNGGTTSGSDRSASETGDLAVSTDQFENDKTVCATINVVLKSYTVSNAPTGFPKQISIPFKVCFYKHNGQAKATFDFNTCKNGTGFKVNVSSISPLAQNLTQNGDVLMDDQAAPQLLIQPVIQVFGRLNKTIEGTPIDEGASYVNKYFLLPTDLNATSEIVLSIDDGDLEEGYYQLSAKVAVITKFPNLVDLQGKASINQTDVSDIMGFTEYMGFLVRNGSDEDTPLLGLQSSDRVPAISDISVNKEGVAIKAGDAITFSWQFVAAGTERCYHDNVEVKTACGSPMIIAAKSFSANVTSHNFSVVMTDVCGNNKTANFTYTADGAKAVSAVDYVNPDVMDDASGTFSSGSKAASSTRKTGVSAAAPLASAVGLLRSTGAAVVASALLMGLLV